MPKYEKKFFKIFNKNFPIFLNQKIFEPNLTTRLIVETASKIIKKNHKVLDLGSGSGIIGCYLYKKKKIKYIYGSDISNEAVKCTLYNSKRVTNNFDIRLSNLLDNWKGEKFNVIINDISGISSKINNITDWFKFAPNKSGKDGIKFTLNILKTFKKNMLGKGYLIFPVIGLSNRDKLIHFLKKKKIKYKIMNKIEWPLPLSLSKKRKLLNRLKKQKLINFKEKFGILFTTTEIFIANSG